MGSSRTPSGVDTGKPPKSCGSRIDPTRTITLHLIPTRSNPASRLLVNSVLPTPGKPVMCIGIRACNPMAMSCTKCRNSKLDSPGTIDTVFHAMAEVPHDCVPPPSWRAPTAAVFSSPHLTREHCGLLRVEHERRVRRDDLPPAVAFDPDVRRPVPAMDVDVRARQLHDETIAGDGRIAVGRHRYVFVVAGRLERLPARSRGLALGNAAFSLIEDGRFRTCRFAQHPRHQQLVGVDAIEGVKV